MKRSGASLLEVVLGLLLMSTAIGAISVLGGRAVACARQEKAIREMSAIADAAGLYHSVNGSWPVDTAILAGYLAGVAGKDPWGGNYTLSSVENSVRVACFVPGVFLVRGRPGGKLLEVVPSGSGNTVSMTSPLSYGRAGRLMFGRVYGASK